MYPPSYNTNIRHHIPCPTSSRTTYHTMYHTTPILYLHHPRGSTIRGHEKSMPNNKDNAVEPRGSTIRAQLCRRSSRSSAAGAHIYSTTTQSKSPTQPSTICFAVYCMNSQPPPCNTNAGGVENSIKTAQANKRAVTRQACQVSGTAEFTGWVAIV